MTEQTATREDKDMLDRYRRAERFLPWNVAQEIDGVLGASWLDAERVLLRRGDRLSALDLSSGVESESHAGDAAAAADVVVSPDGAFELRRAAGNLELHDRASGVSRLLTDDGGPQFEWGGAIEGNARTITERRLGVTVPLRVLWSPDSRYVLTHRIDERAVAVSHLIEHVRPGARRPILHSYRENDWEAGKPQLESVVIEVATGRRQTVSHGSVPVLIESPLGWGEAWWSPDSSCVCLLVRDDGGRSFRVVSHDPEAGATRILLTEQIDIAIRTSSDFGRPGLQILWGRGEVIVWAERDGHGHLWLHDLTSGALIRQLTSGDWIVRGVVHVDEASGQIWFLGAGRNPKANPYHRQLLRTSLDGGPIEQLTDDESDHAVAVSPDGSRFLDSFGSIDRFPETVVRSLDGAVTHKLGRASAPGLSEAGWWPPEPLEVTVDGVSLYGALYVPTDFDPSRRYSLLDDVYCANLNRVPARLPGDGDPWGEVGYWFPQAVAELGFCVLVLDGRGGPLRSLEFRRHGWVNTIDDHAKAVSLIGAERPYLDLDRVGIYGHSAGGFIATQGLVDHPDVFTVGVASAASFCLDVTPWGDNAATRAAGAGVAGRFDVTQRLGNLRGELLVVTGEVDEIVPPVHLMRFLDALIEANKDVDLVVLPNANHSFKPHPYFIRRLWDHIVRHLLGKAPPTGYEVRADDDFALRMLSTDTRTWWAREQRRP